MCAKITVMVYVFLGVLGLIAGSFVNALIWRLHEQEQTNSKYNKASNITGKSAKTSLKRAQNTTNKPEIDLSITKGRSICPNCYHQLKASDLMPVISWLLLKGKCRYCHKPISVQYPLVELATAILFVVSYIFWPVALTGVDTILFALWLIVLTGLVALSVYDLKWFLLPNRIIYPLSAVAGLFALINVIISDNPLTAAINLALAVLIGGGIFYLIYQLSKGKWIGGGDVRLGWLLGALAMTPTKSVLFIFMASLLGTLVSLLMVLTRRFKRHQLIPFGPFLIAGLFITMLWGDQIIDWYVGNILIL